MAAFLALVAAMAAEEAGLSNAPAVMASAQALVVTAVVLNLARGIPGLLVGRSLGAEAVFATRVGERNGCLTGEVLGLYPRGENKRTLIRQLAAERGLDLAASYAYGDDWYDLPMLESVGHPVAVNPCPRLREEAERRGGGVEEVFGQGRGGGA